MMTAIDEPNVNPTPDPAGTAAKDDLDRVRTVYAERALRLEGSTMSDRPNPGELHMAQSMERALLAMLSRKHMLPLKSREILDIGCGTGSLLLELLVDGADLGKLHGVDLLEERISRAHSLSPNLDFRCADAQQLPYDSDRFDLVIQCTVFTSILDETMRQRIAREMIRVLRKPQGLIVWYDFWVNPRNKETRGIRRAELRELFPDCALDIRSLTLAPPIVRRLAPVSWLSCDALEALRFLNTHYLAAIRPVLGDGRQPA